MTRHLWFLIVAAFSGFAVAMVGVGVGSLHMVGVGAFVLVLVLADLVGLLFATRPEPRGDIVHLPHATAPDTFEPEAYHDAIQKALGRMRGDQW